MLLIRQAIYNSVTNMPRFMSLCAVVFLQSAIKRRDTLQLEYETLCEDRDRKKVLHDEV